MKAIVFDFKQSINTNHEVAHKDNIEKNKDFSSTLKSINNKIDEKRHSSNNKNLAKTKDHNTNNKTEETKVEDTENLDAVEKEDKKKKIAYENLMFLANNMINTVEDDNVMESAEGQEISIEANDIILENEDLDIESFEENKDIIENEFDFEKLLISKADHEKDKGNLGNKEVSEENANLAYNEIKPEPKGAVRENTKGIEEDISLDNEVNSELISSVTQEEQSVDLENNNSKEMSSKDNLEANSVKENSKEDKINNEPSFSIHKQDVEYTKNISTELEKPEVVNPKEVVNQIVEKVKIDLAGEKNEIRIQLKPEVLGEMLMNIEVAKNEVIAKVIVDNQRTKEIIEANLIQLREEIKDTGLEIKTFEVFVGNSSDFDKHNPNKFNFNQNNKRLKIKSENKKAISNYEDTSVEVSKKTENIYSENGLDLLA